MPLCTRRMLNLLANNKALTKKFQLVSICSLDQACAICTTILPAHPSTTWFGKNSPASLSWAQVIQREGLPPALGLRKRFTRRYYLARLLEIIETSINNRMPPMNWQYRFMRLSWVKIEKEMTAQQAHRQRKILGATLLKSSKRSMPSWRMWCHFKKILAKVLSEATIISLRALLSRSCAKTRAIITIAILKIRGQRQRLKMEVETTQGQCSSIVAMISTITSSKAKIRLKIIRRSPRS